jgi:uncharacterized protein YndB with AHSA1/START domain
MESYQCTVKLINIPLQKAYEAITSQEGLASWWTETCTVETKEGGHATFRFDETYNVMEIEELTPPSKVQWKCIDEHHVDKLITKSNEWVGSQLIFELKEDNQGNTDLNFIHKGLIPSLQCYDICQNSWDHFIKTSLKNHLETGHGQPYQIWK